MDSLCHECIEKFRSWGADPRQDGSCTSYACGNYAGKKEREIERWGEYIVNGNPPAHFSTKQDWNEAKQAYGRRVRQDVVEIERKVQGLNKALANHLATTPEKASQTQTPTIRTIGI